MPRNVILLSIPGLRERDLPAMPNLSALAGGGRATLIPSFPAVTCPVQANMTTGTLPKEHAVIANGYYWRVRQQVEMWTAWNESIQREQIWDKLHKHDPKITSAIWFPLHAKGANADYICTPAPIHNPDGGESLWCYTKPEDMYGHLRDEFGHFPLQHFWGPLAGIQSSAWIVATAIWAAKKYRPNFFYIYLPHLDYAAQKFGPDTDAAQKALGELDAEIGKLVAGLNSAYDEPPLWLAAGEYAIVPVSRVIYPNRILRKADLLDVREQEDGEHLNLGASIAWALCDHQFAHIFVRDALQSSVDKVVDLFKNQPGIAEVLTRDDQIKYGIDHGRGGEIVLVCEPDTWLAYYWWLTDDRAPAFARTVDIHNKPGYDPVELFFDPATKSIPLDPTLVKGSHGAPARDPAQQTVFLASEPNVFVEKNITDTDVAGIVLHQFGIQAKA